MSYESQLQKFQALGMDAIERLVKDNAELFLSVSEEDAARKIVALTRLRANELPTPQTESEMYNILADLLGELLASGQIQIASYGLSIQGENQRRALVARVTPPAEPDAMQADDPFADIVNDWKTLHAGEFKAKWMSNSEGNKKYAAAIAAGRI